MDVSVEVIKRDLTSIVSISVSYCDTDETLLHHIAHELESLPSFLEWDTVPTWGAVGKRQRDRPFRCRDVLSFVRHSNELKFPEGIPETAANTNVFYGTHRLVDDPNFIRYFGERGASASLTALNKETQLHAEVMTRRDALVTFCAEAEPLQLADVTTRFKQFLISLPAATSIDAVFRTLALSQELPFASYDGVARTLDYFSPPVEWLELSRNLPVFKARQDANAQEFCTGVVVEEPGSGLFCILDTSEVYKTADENRILAVLRRAFNDEGIVLVEQRTFMTYDIVGLELHDCYLADMIMNDLAQLFYVDEFAKASKATNRLYIHLVDETAAVNLAQNYTHKAFQFNIAPGTPYVSVRIKAENAFLVGRMQTLVACLVGYYKRHLDKLRKFYSKYIPVRNDREFVAVTVEKKPLKLIAPDIFLPMYSRRCLNMPDLADGPADADRPSMVFPVFGESEPRTYVCRHEKYKYPGLRVNELANRHIFPFVPCCYSKDQRLNPDSKLNKYLSRRPGKPKIKHSQGAILNLPPVLKRYLTYTDPLNDYIALSNPPGPASFVAAVHYALHKERLPDGVVQAIAALPAELTAQERPGLGAEDERDAILPRTHIRLLEIFYGVSIFLFDKNGPVLPHFARRYLKPVPAGKSVLIYIKSELHCMPVVMTGATTAYSPRSAAVRSFYRHLEILAPNRFTNQSVAAYFSRFEIENQLLNADGHCVFFVVRLEGGGRLPIATDPQIPFAAPIGGEVWRLKDPKTAFMLFPDARCVARRELIREVLVPFAPRARVLTRMPADAVVDPGRISERGEMYGNMVSSGGAILDEFIEARKDAKETFEALEARVPDLGRGEPYNEFVGRVRAACAAILPETIDANATGTAAAPSLVDKLAALLLAKRRSRADRRGFDVWRLGLIPGTVASFDRVVLAQRRAAERRVDDLVHVTAKDPILIDGRLFIRSDMGRGRASATSSDMPIPELVFFRGALFRTDTYDRIDAMTVETFRAVYDGVMRTFTAVKEPSQ